MVGTATFALHSPDRSKLSASLTLTQSTYLIFQNHSGQIIKDFLGAVFY